MAVRAFLTGYPRYIPWPMHRFMLRIHASMSLLVLFRGTLIINSSWLLRGTWNIVYFNFTKAMKYVLCRWNCCLAGKCSIGLVISRNFKNTCEGKSRARHKYRAAKLKWLAQNINHLLSRLHTIPSVLGVLLNFEQEGTKVLFSVMLKISCAYPIVHFVVVYAISS